jgi:hypothetical protein
MRFDSANRNFGRLLTVFGTTAALLIATGAAARADTAVAAPIELAAAGKHHSRASIVEASGPAGPTVVSTLYEDPDTGQLFTRPGAGRRQVAVPAALLGGGSPAPTELDKAIEQKAQEAAQKEVAKYQEQQGITNASLASQLQLMQPGMREFGERWLKKIRIGTTIYADYQFLTHAGWGPQTLENINPPGPGNSLYNSFDLTRGYLNLFFSPTDDFTLRVTPEIYRELEGNSNFNLSSGQPAGRTSAVGSNLQGQIGMRFKFIYIDWNTPFKNLGIDAIKEDKVTFGQEEAPFVPWEEALYGFRYVNLVPWNYVSLSSTYPGLSVKGPIKFNEVQYVDYDFGVFNNQSWTGYERTNTKQAMARVSVYPFGAKSRFEGLGLTGFYDYGYSNATPDSTLPGSSRSNHLERLAALVHYWQEKWSIAGEFDYGHNAFTGNNLFSGSGPGDFFTPPAALATQSPIAAAATVLQNSSQSQQLGWDFFGRYQILDSPFTAFGMYQQWLPNTKAQFNPFDFERFIVGLEYKWNKYLRMALDSQNLLFYHSQKTVSASDVQRFGSAAYAAAFPTGIAFSPTQPSTVPRDTHGIFFNIEFNY